MARISKSDYMLWRDCPKNAWLKIHKPEVFYASDLTDFDKSIIDTGIDVEEIARGLFPGGLLIPGRDERAQQISAELLAKKTATLFQPIFECDGFVAAIDVLELDSEAGTYAIEEIKSSTRFKEEHLYDVAFQTLVLRLSGLKIEQVSIIHLNAEYVRVGDIDLGKLFNKIDVTTMVKEVAETVTNEMEVARTYLLNEVEPVGPCSCIYRGRSRHCSTFQYSNPDVPEYGVHDISRIGHSPKKLKEMVDAGIFALENIPTHIKLSDIQQAQVQTYNSKETIINRNAIAGELEKLELPLYFIDYETHPAAIPLFDRYSPYDQIPFQYSLHIVTARGEEPAHKEFLHIALEDPSELLVKSLRENIGPRGSIIVWHKTFESKVNNELARRLPEAQEFMVNFNSRLYDLKDVFSKQYYVHRDLWGKVSIKNVLPVLAPHLDYSTLEIQEGGTASVVWSRIVFGQMSDEECNGLRAALKKYCSMDSYGMYAIWRALSDMVAA
jgi:hypothetical protein